MSGTPSKRNAPFESRLTLRLPAADALAWREAASAAGLGLSDWLRQAVARSSSVPGAASGRGLRPRTAEPADGRLLRLLSNVSSSLNQLARASNAAIARGEPLELIQVLVALKSIQDAVYELLPN